MAMKAICTASMPRITELSEIFTTGTRLEAQFWQMGLNATAETRA